MEGRSKQINLIVWIELSIRTGCSRRRTRRHGEGSQSIPNDGVQRLVKNRFELKPTLCYLSVVSYRNMQ
jgi:hypothetical protein